MGMDSGLRHRRRVLRAVGVASGPVALALACGTAQAAFVGLGPAGSYNLFSLRDVNASSSEVGGRIAAGRNATFSSYSVGSRLTSGTNLVVGRSLDITGGTVTGTTVVGGQANLNNPTFGGSLDVAGSINHSNWGGFGGNVTVGGGFTSTGFSTSSALRVGQSISITNSGTISGGVDVLGNASIATPTISNGLRANGSVTLTGGGSVSPGVTHGGTFSGPNYISRTSAQNAAVVPAPRSLPVDFDAAATYLRDASRSWGALAATGSHVLQWSTRTLTGGSSSLNVFNLSAADFNGVHAFNIVVPQGSTTLINVLGSNVTLPNIGWTLNGAALGSNGSGADFGSLLWNFPEASSLSVASLGGSLLAPQADLNFASGQWNGTVIANNFAGQGALFERPFTGALPDVSFTGPGSNIVPEPSILGALILPAMLLMRQRR